MSASGGPAIHAGCPLKLNAVLAPCPAHAVPVFSPDALVEERIQEAMRRGEFDHLPGAGRPLALDDAQLVPPEVRIAHRILKNAGYVPPEVHARREIAELEGAIAAMDGRRRAEARADEARRAANPARCPPLARARPGTSLRAQDACADSR